MASKIIFNKRIKLWAWCFLSPIWELQVIFGHPLWIPEWAVKDEGKNAG